LRENAESVLVPSAKANAVTGSRCSPDTPSLTSPEERPDSRTTRIAMRATTPPIRPKRAPAKISSRQARNMGLLLGGGGVRAAVCRRVVGKIPTLRRQNSREQAGVLHADGSSAQGDA